MCVHKHPPAKKNPEYRICKIRVENKGTHVYIMNHLSWRSALCGDEMAVSEKVLIRYILFLWRSRRQNWKGCNCTWIFPKKKLMHTLKMILVFWMLRFAINIFIKYPTINKLKYVILRKLISKDRKCGQTIYVWAIMALFKLFKTIKNSFKNSLFFYGASFFLSWLLSQ